MTEAALQAVLRRDRLVVVAALAVVIALAWTYVLWLAADMTMGGMDTTGYRAIPAGMGLMIPDTVPWAPIEFVYVLLMWVVMMVGMMTPSVAPMILIYGRVGGQAAALGKPFAPSIWFVGGYLLVWATFSVAATLAQWALQRLGLLSPMMASSSALLGGGLLIAAGLYQWTPAKNICLHQCQAPVLFIQTHGGFRGDSAGALVLGARHGAYCVGCCWTLMALLFVGGVMNVLWIATIAIFILMEKVFPTGRIVSRIAGAGLVVSGLWLLAKGPGFPV